MLSDKLVDKYCEQIALGLSGRKVSAMEGMPSTSTVGRWITAGRQGKDPKYFYFWEQYTRAREQQAWAWLDKPIELAEDLIEKSMAGMLDNTQVQAIRVAIDAYKWNASKLLTKELGLSEDTKSDSVVQVFVDKPANETREEWLARQKTKKAS